MELVEDKNSELYAIEPARYTVIVSHAAIMQDFHVDQTTQIHKISVYHLILKC